MYLADACALIAFFSNREPDRIMPAAAPIMRDRDVGVLAITVWEIGRKVAVGKLPRLWEPWPSLTALLSDQHYVPEAFTWEDAEAVQTLPAHHRDPMDRMLIAAALRADKTVITSDRIFQSYNVRTVW